MRRQIPLQASSILTVRRDEPRGFGGQSTGHLFAMGIGIFRAKVEWSVRTLPTYTLDAGA